MGVCSDRLYREWIYQCEVNGIAVMVEGVVGVGYCHDQEYVEVSGYGIVVREYMRCVVVH